MTRLWILALIVAGFLAWWYWDSYCYNRDLEADFIRETGMTWKEAERKVWQ